MHAGLSKVFISESTATVHKTHTECMHNVVSFFFTNVEVIYELLASSDQSVHFRGTDIFSWSEIKLHKLKERKTFDRNFVHKTFPLSTPKSVKNSVIKAKIQVNSKNLTVVFELKENNLDQQENQCTHFSRRLCL